MPEDLMATVLAADAIHRQQAGEPPQRFVPWERLWIEPWFNILGWAMGAGLDLLPWGLYRRAIQRVNIWMGGRPAATSEQLPLRSREFAAMAEQLHQKTGQWPATFVFTSHPETVGSLEWLRFELLRQSLILAEAVVEKSQPGRLFRSNPQCFLAIDPYALDTISAPVAGWYAGFMNRLYLVLDRMSATQSHLQRAWLLRRTGYTHIVFRLLNKVRRGHPVVMVLAGGLPQNARLLYTAREFVHHLPAPRWPGSKRAAQKLWMEALITPADSQMPCETGVLPPATRAALAALLGQWGFSAAEEAGRLDEFAKEFRLEVPYRTRLFRVLLGRIAAKGQPLLWCAALHRDTPPHIQFSRPWGVYRDNQGTFQCLRGETAPAPVSTPAALAEEFSREYLV